MTDIIIIGGGTAGLTAGIYASRAGKSVQLFEKENTGGQIVYSPLVENYPGMPGMSGADFSEKITAQAEGLGVNIEYAEVLSVKKKDGVFCVETDMGEYSAKAVIIATGAAHRTLGLEKEEDLTGCGVSYCAVCDGAFYSGCDVAVMGGGNTALQDAVFLSNTCSHVTLIHRRDKFRGEQKLVEQLEKRENVDFMLDSTVSELVEEDGALVEIGVKNLKTNEVSRIKISGLFIAIGQIPQTECFKELVDTDAAGYLDAGEDCVCSQEGIFAAGDCRTKEVRQLTTAAGDGACAGLAACRYVDAH